jgi:lipopolysaccharide transport system ATP-binding protein
MSDVTIRVDGLWKKLCRGMKQGMFYATADMGRDLVGVRGKTETLRPGEFWAMQDVSFEMRRGESVALIGVNGAGKSTLLKLLNGIMRPDRGQVEIKGRIGALIEVGAGFHPMLTGRENVYVNGAILGMSKREVDRKFDEIVAFSELDSASLDAPVRTYSSGMYVRLGFAVAVHTDPDILLVDEVLAVGDARFTAKCRKKIAELRNQGTGIVFVSHSLSLVEEVCNRGILLAQGKVLADGGVSTVIQAYRAFLNSEAAQQSGGAGRPASHTAPPVRLISGELLDYDGNNTSTVDCGERVALRLMVATTTPISSGVLSIWMVRADDGQMVGMTYLEVGRELPTLNSGELTLNLNCQMVPGEYRIGCTFSTDGEFDVVDEITACTVSVTPARHRRSPTQGAYMLDVTFKDSAEAYVGTQIPAALHQPLVTHGR